MMSGTESLASSQFHCLFLSSLSFVLLLRLQRTLCLLERAKWKGKEGKGKGRKQKAERSKYNKFKISSRSHHEIGNLSARRSRRCPLCVSKYTTFELDDDAAAPATLLFMPICNAFPFFFYLHAPWLFWFFQLCSPTFFPFPFLALCSLSLSRSLALSLFNCLFTLELLSSSSSSFSSKRRSSSVAEAYIIAAGAAQMQKRRELLVAAVTTTASTA